IRGHRRTYIGSMPGRIIQQMKRVGVTNPVFLLDEVDKMSSDFRGDPSAALLEALDPEINKEFVDHYLEIPYDLSGVMFITTANLTQPIPPPLLDRMEVIRLSGYTEEEKLNIAKLHLLPRQLKEHGLNEESLKISDSVVLEIIRRYTREAGVRNLERELAQVCRKHTACLVAEHEEKNGDAVEKGEKGKSEKGGKKRAAKADIEQKCAVVTKKNLEKYLGKPKHRYGVIGETDEVGLATGMAWTQTGGEILSIEATLMPGKGELILTGLLGDVMKESAQAALSYARAHSEGLNLGTDYFKNTDIHLHVPEGAIPKDGPSAGIALAVSLISALSGRPVDRNVAMTGEITLRGRALPVGGIKEKVFAAHRAGITKIILPVENEKDYYEIQPNVRRNLEALFVDHVEQALKATLKGEAAGETEGANKNAASRGGGKSAKK
ncbi:MAG TPA: magnesium chelatase domain-containing protein, partial [bacterium]|nr:magnesium chelatase domain-containing protein [bacterium]